MVALEEKSDDHQVSRIHPLGTMNVLVKWIDTQQYKHIQGWIFLFLLSCI